MSDYLIHYGVKGMKWGVRKQPERTGARSFRGSAHRALAGVYGINERFYNRTGNKTLASMNSAARSQQLKKADRLDAEKQKKVDAQNSKIKNKVDPKIAKNNATRRVANDYHSLTNDQFRRKYKVSKKTFARRYKRTKGDTYSAGLRKQAAALAFLNAKQGNGAIRTTANIAKYTQASKTEQKLRDKGHNATASILNQVSGNSMRREYADTYYMPEYFRKKYHLEK